VKEKERGKAGKEGGHSLIFTCTDATAPEPRYTRISETSLIGKRVLTKFVLKFSKFRYRCWPW